MPRVLGIDLGTTNSCVSVLDGDNPMVIPMEDGRFTLPSVVAFLENGRHLVGAAAKRQAANNPANTIFVAKRIIGRPFADPQTQAAMEAVPYRCVEGPHGDVRIEARGRQWAIQEISALILAELRRAAEAQFNESITQAVITVPAYFSDAQRQATRDAAEIAGLQVLRIINEPTAAALAHGFLFGATRRVAVYDLGGGTFDVSVLRMGNGNVEVLATAGDAFLGGRDCDNKIVDWLLQTINTNYSVDLSDHVDAVQRLREAAETAKIALSEQDAATLALPFLATTADGKPLHVEVELTRTTLDQLCRELVQRSVTLFKETLKAAEIEADEIDELVLVGGMTRMPLVRESVEGIVGRSAATGVHPDLVVAVGAAIQAGMMKADAPKTTLVDVTPHNLGISTVAGIAETVIPKDTSLPTEVRKMFTTVRDGQMMVSIIVYQGESRKMQGNTVLGQFNLNGLKPAPRGTVTIEVTFSISVDGIVSVSARDVATGANQAITIENSRTLDDKERSRMAALHKDQVANATSGSEANA